MNKETLKLLLGPVPEPVLLESAIEESTDCGVYIREKVSYAVEASERISAYLLIPKRANSAPAAAVYCHHQHAGNFSLGKSEVVGLAGDPDQSYAAELAERGYIAFAPDAIAFEERNWSDEAGEAEYFEFSTRLVQGRTLLAKVLHDVSVGMNYLAHRPEVDSQRIGFIGHSYGGRMAIWAAAFDERIKASVSHCGCITYKDSLGRDAGIQMVFCVPGITNVCDIGDVVSMIEPRALLISATNDDVWSRGAEELYKSAKPFFKSGTLGLKVWPGTHKFTKQMREEAYRFLAAHL